MRPLEPIREKQDQILKKSRANTKTEHFDRREGRTSSLISYSCYTLFLLLDCIIYALNQENCHLFSINLINSDVAEKL